MPEHASALPKLPKIISVGNITMGGTGKTPLTITLARHYIAEGKRVCILSRGYRGKLGYDTHVISDGSKLHHTPPHAADEPFMMATELPDLMVVTGKNRRASYALAMARFAPDVFILDDGFQHSRMPRDYNVVILSYDRPFANGRVFPLGTLRQSPKSLRKADAIVITGVPRLDILASDSTDSDNTSDPASFSDPTIARIRQYVRHGQPMFVARYAVEGIFRCTDTSNLRSPVVAISDGSGDGVDNGDSLRNSRVILVSAIAGNDRFSRTVEGLGYNVVARFPFRDHHPYKLSDIRRIQSVADGYAGDGGAVIFTTQKDYVKLAPWFGSQLYYVKVDLEFDNLQGFLSHLDTTLAGSSMASALSG